MKKLFLVLVLSLLTLKQSPVFAQELTPEAQAKAMSAIELVTELNLQFGKIGLACTLTAFPVVAIGVVDTVPLLSALPIIDFYDGGFRDFHDSYVSNPNSPRTEYAAFAGGAGSLATDIIAGAADLVIAPFDYLAHGELKFEYKAFPTVRESYNSIGHHKSIVNNTERVADTTSSTVAR